MQINQDTLRKMDKIGASLSLLCAVHCLFQPVLLIFLPLMGLGFIADPIVENIFISATLLLASLALVWGYRLHGEKKVFLILGLGILSIVSSRFIEPEPLFAVSGALLITLAHVLNLSLRPHHASDGHFHPELVRS